MIQRYHAHYRTLGIEPGASWQDLRYVYKKRMRQWHPDRFPDGHRQKREAEETSKTLNQAYNELSEYYRQNGCLPLNEHPSPPSAPDLSQTEAARNAPTNDSGNFPSTEPAHSAVRRNFRLTGTLPLAVVVATIIAYYLLPIGDPQTGIQPTIPDSRSSTTGNGQPRTTPPSITPESAAPVPDNRFFSVGSSLGMVYSIQGVPTKTETNLWWYGDAVVHFRDGRVEKWDDPSGRTLKAQLTPAPTVSIPTEIQRGSTKNEVFAIQGEPTRKTDSTWEYGASRIRFENDRVASWYESPLNPLHLRR